MHFLDTNIFIYSIFPNVDKQKHLAVVKLFKKAALGEIVLWATEWVIAELIWFLGRKNFSWREVQEAMLTEVFKTKGLEIRGQTWLEETVKKAKKTTDFIDLVNLRILKDEKIKFVYSYDGGLDNYKGFKRLEP